MVKVIACRDHGWIDRKTDFQQWNHVCRAYGAFLELVEEPQEGIIPEGHTVVVLEEQGTTNLEDFDHPKDAVYVFGRSGLNGIQEMIDYDASVKIKTVDDVCLFGISAVGIVLYDRMMKDGN